MLFLVLYVQNRVCSASRASKGAFGAATGSAAEEITGTAQLDTAQRPPILSFTAMLKPSCIFAMQSEVPSARSVTELGRSPMKLALMAPLLLRSVRLNPSTVAEGRTCSMDAARTAGGPVPSSNA